MRNHESPSDFITDMYRSQLLRYTVIICQLLGQFIWMTSNVLALKNAFNGAFNLDPNSPWLSVGILSFVLLCKCFVLVFFYIMICAGNWNLSSLLQVNGLEVFQPWLWLTAYRGRLWSLEPSLFASCDWPAGSILFQTWIPIFGYPSDNLSLTWILFVFKQFFWYSASIDWKIWRNLFFIPYGIIPFLGPPKP